MSEWQGFDQRKVCPQCGEYQTGLGISERRRDPQNQRSMRIVLIVAVFITLLLVALTVATAIVKEVSFTNPRVVTLFFSLFIIIGSGASRIIVRYLNSRQNPSLADTPLQPGERPTFYHLHCRNCGYEWEMTIDEWEQSVQEELHNQIHK